MKTLVTYKTTPQLAQHENVIYRPAIGYFSPSQSREYTDISHFDAELEARQKEMASLLTRGDITTLVVGNNPVRHNVLTAWREAVGRDIPLMVIRRGTETGAISKSGANESNIFVTNTPDINSFYVGQHMLNQLKFTPSDAGKTLLVFGLGSIGKVVAKQAMSSGLKVHLYSPSMCDPDRKRVRMNMLGLCESDRVRCFSSMDEAMCGADYAAISIPWRSGENPGDLNRGIVGAHTVENLLDRSKIISVSNPGIFTDAALATLAAKEVKMRIDTGAAYAIAFRLKHPHSPFETHHDEAFAQQECQAELDNAVLHTLKQFRLHNTHTVSNHTTNEERKERA